MVSDLRAAAIPLAWYAATIMTFPASKAASGNQREQERRPADRSAWWRRVPAFHFCRRAGGLPLLLSVAWITGLAAVARGDGGVVRFNGPAGPFDVTVFTAPTPLRAGPVDISVLVRDRTVQQPVLDAQVVVRLVPANAMSSAVAAVATRARATNKLLYAALAALPAPGSWNMQVTIRHGAGTATVSQPLEVARPLPPLLAFWPYLAVPPVCIALFILHQWLSRT
jgi:hypothetical protein